LILGSALRFALRATLLRAWTLRSGRWLAVAGAILVLGIIQRARPTKPPRTRADA
jgi:hypothetical protein